MATITTNCTYSNPVRYDGTVPTLPTHVFFFRDSVCTDNATTSSTSVGFNPSVITSTTSTTSVPVYAFFSAGDIMISLLLFLLGVLKLFEITVSQLDRIKWKKKWLGYGGGDVEIKEEP